MSIEKRIRKTGISYRIVVSAGYKIDENGKKKQKRYSKTYRVPDNLSESKAYKKALLIEEELQSKANMLRYTPNELTFGFLWETYKLNRLKLQKQTTQFTTLNIVETQLLPTFKEVKLDQINMYMIQNFLNNCKRITKNDEPLKPAYINTIKNKLHTILQYAVELEWLNKNPCDFCKVTSKIYPKENYVFSITNIKEIYSCLKQENIYDDIIKFQLLTGLRISETLALTNGDINFEENYIDINKTVTKINSKNVIGTPKTKNAYRRIYINQPIKEIIDRNLKTHLLFSMNGTYVNKTNIRLRLKSVLKDTSYCHLTLHDLRHINSSLLLYNNVDLKSISSHLGHSSIRVTSDIYLHTTEEANAKLSLNIESIFNELDK